MNEAKIKTEKVSQYLYIQGLSPGWIIVAKGGIQDVSLIWIKFWNFSCKCQWV